MRSEKIPHSSGQKKPSVRSLATCLRQVVKSTENLPIGSGGQQCLLSVVVGPVERELVLGRWVLSGPSEAGLRRVVRIRALVSWKPPRSDVGHAYPTDQCGGRRGIGYLRDGTADVIRSCPCGGGLGKRALGAERIVGILRVGSRNSSKERFGCNIRD